MPLPIDMVPVSLTNGPAADALRRLLGSHLASLPSGPIHELTNLGLQLANGGRVVITLRDGAAGRQLGRLELNGPGDALPAGGTANRTIALAAGPIGSALAGVTEVAVVAGTVE